MNDYDDVVSRLFMNKRRLGLKQSDIAKRLGCSQPAVSMAMNADNMSLRKFLELCDALKLRVEVNVFIESLDDIEEGR